MVLGPLGGIDRLRTDRPTETTETQELKMAVTVNLSKIINPLDIECDIDGQAYVPIAVDGPKITFKSNCPTCGEEFTCWALLDKMSWGLNRRCEKHRQPGVRVKPPKSKIPDKFLNAFATDPDTVIAELRKKRAAGKTMKQLVKWMWETQGVHCTGKEIWKLVRTVEIASNVTPIFRPKPQK
jgi:hypothetical protein